ncbi:MAG: GNAT family N-acetyltransferase [Pseudomonadota bacterium]
MQSGTGLRSTLGRTLGPTLETDRLLLRPIDMEADFQGFCDTFSDADTMRFLGGKTKSPAETWRTMATFLGHHLARGYSFLSVIEKATGDWVGEVGPWYPEGWPDREVGWTLHPAHRGKGYAREAGRAAIDYVRDDLGWPSVIHIIEDGNVGSERVAEALGSTRLRTLDRIPGIGEGVFNIYGQDF